MPKIVTVYFSVLLLLPLIVDCGGDKKTQLVDLPKYTEMKNITEAPPALRQAAKAVVKLTTGDGGYGSASFISADGL